MTRVLIVDDDPNQVKLLARVMAARDPGLSIATAHGVKEAITQLRAMPVDVVLTDLQMPEVSGFELVNWLLAHQPHVHTFAMTAYPDEQAVSRLRRMGGVECYTKPLDVAEVLAELSDSLAQGVRGHVRNIALPSLLQVFEMERKTCTLTVSGNGTTGYLYMRDGQVVDARLDDTSGDDAAMRVVAWNSPDVTITNNCATTQHTVELPLARLLLEAMRRVDESTRPPGEEAEASGDAFGGRPTAVTGLIEEEVPTARYKIPPPGSYANSSPDEASLADDHSAGNEPSPSEPAETDASLDATGALSRFPDSPPPDADAIAIVETASGRVRHSAGHFQELPAIAKLAAVVYSHECSAVAGLEIDDTLQELVMTTAKYWMMARPVNVAPPSLALLVFDPRRANVVLERLELDALVRTIEASLERAG